MRRKARSDTAFYDPQIGLFLSVDLMAAYSNTLAQFHRYRWANNNPCKFTDPDGRQSSLPYIDAYLRHYYRNGLNNPPENRGGAKCWQLEADVRCPKRISPTG
ncbi:RHS repeat-associated core domain-containing protein [Stenotrophomonas sp. GZD-301]|uniref:RHS repeat-associated core domain-containing protein n=1 Tax=Stenotrophomonas sp. GZD-301 TaxID=3404814 RepID=UPI003BB599B8